MIDARLPGQSAEQAGGVQARAGAEDPALGQAQAQCQLPGDDVAGVGDVHHHAVKAAGLDFLRVAPDGGNGEVHLLDPVVIALKQRDLTRAVDDDIAFAQVGKVSGANGDPVGQVGCGVPQVLHFTLELLLILIHQHQLVGDALHRQGIGYMGAHMAQADDAYHTILSHLQNLLYKKYLLHTEMGKQHAGVEHGQHHVHPQDNGKGREGALHDLIFVADLVHGGAGGYGVIGADKVTQGGAGI